MSNKPFNLKSISLKIKTDRPVRKTPYQVKGILMKQFPDSEIVPMLNGSYRKKYLYPRIQVKILNEQIIIFAINEGVKPLLKIQDFIKELNFGDITFKVDDLSNEKNTEFFTLTPFLNEYNFISNWAALNHSTKKQYLAKNDFEKLDFLNTLLGENLIFLARELGSKLNNNIFSKISVDTLIPAKTEQRNWGLFQSKLFLNVKLPNYIGLGNGITGGFGAIENSSSEVTDFEPAATLNDLRKMSIKSKPVIEDNNFSSSLIEFDPEKVSKPKLLKKRRPKRKKEFIKKSLRTQKNNSSKSKNKSKEPINYNSHEYHQKQHTIV